MITKRFIPEGWNEKTAILDKNNIDKITDFSSTSIAFLSTKSRLVDAIMLYESPSMIDISYPKDIVLFMRFSWISSLFSMRSTSFIIVLTTLFAV